MFEVIDGLNNNDNREFKYGIKENYYNHRNLNIARRLYYLNPDLAKLTLEANEVAYIVSIFNGKVVLTAQHIQTGLLMVSPLTPEYPSFQEGDLVRYYKSKNDPNIQHYLS